MMLLIEYIEKMGKYRRLRRTAWKLSNLLHLFEVLQILSRDELSKCYAELEAGQHSFEKLFTGKKDEKLEAAQKIETNKRMWQVRFWS